MFGDALEHEYTHEQADRTMSPRWKQITFAGLTVAVVCTSFALQVIGGVTVVRYLDRWAEARGYFGSK